MYMYSVISIHALHLRYEAGRRALCTEPTCGNAVRCDMVDESAQSADELIISHPHVLPLTICSMYNDYTHITIHKILHTISDIGGNHVIKE